MKYNESTSGKDCSEAKVTHHGLAFAPTRTMRPKREMDPKLSESFKAGATQVTTKKGGKEVQNKSINVRRHG